MMNIWSCAYIDENDNYTCYVNPTLWRTITSEQETHRMFAHITKGDKFWICALGNPIVTEFDNSNSLFVPNWMLDQIDTNGDGEELQVLWMPSESFDHSSKIVLQSLDTSFETTSIQDVLSYELTKLAILQKGTKIILNIEELDGYTITYIVKNIEPASVVLCEGDEVCLEFYNDNTNEKRPDTPFAFEPEPIQEPVERFNPWRNKDFKPNIS